MPAQNRNLILIIALLILGIGGFLLFQGETGNPEQPGPELVETPEPEAPPATEQSPRVAVELDTGRRKIAAAASWVPRDPEWRKALGGIKGRLLELSGEPATGLEVAVLGDWLPTVMGVLQGVLVEEEMDFNPLLDSCLTDKEGRFQLKGLYPGETALVRISDKRQTLLSFPIPQVPKPGEVVDLGDITLPGFATVKGRLVDEVTGKPVPGAEVFLSTLPGVAATTGLLDLKGGEWILIRMGGRREPMTMLQVPANVAHLRRLMTFPTDRTDKEGRFTIDRVPQGRLNLSAGKSGYQWARKLGIRTRAGEVREVGDLTMTTQNRITVTVKDTEGQPIQGAAVLAGVMPGLVPAAILRHVGRSDKDGRVVVNGMADGQIFLAGARKGEGWQVVGPLAGTEQVIVLGKGHNLVLQVVDGEAGEKVTVKPDKVVLTSLMSKGSLHKHVKIDEEGRINLSNLNEGNYFLRVGAKGYMELIHGITIPDRRTKEGEVKLLRANRGHYVELLVKDQQGGAVKGARIMPLPDELFRGSSPRFSPNLGASFTDDRGRLKLGPLLMGRKVLSVWHPRLGAAIEMVKVPHDGVQEVILTAGRIAGRIDPVQPDPNGLPWQVFLFCDKNPVPVQSTRVKPDGTFVFDPVSAGRAQIQLIPAQPLQPVEAFFFGIATNTIQPEAEERVRVKSGETTPVVLKLRSLRNDAGTIEGIVFKDGRPAEGITVMAGRWRGPRAVTQTNGFYRIKGVKAGTVNITVGVQDPGFEGDVRKVTGATLKLGRGDLRRQDFQIYSGKIEGRVVDRKGIPFGNVMVKAYPEKSAKGAGSIECLTDARGCYTIEMVPPGKWRLNIRGENCKAGKPVFVDLPQGGRMTAADLTGLRTTRVTLRLDPPPAEGVQVRGLRFESTDGQLDKPIDQWFYSKSGVVPASLPPGSYKVQVYEGQKNVTVREGRLVVPTVPKGAIRVSLGAPADPFGVQNRVVYGGVLKTKKGKVFGPATMNFYRRSWGPSASVPHFANSRRLQAEVDAEGRFSTELPPGDYTCWASRRPPKKGQSNYISGRIKVPAGGDTAVELKL